MATIYDIAKIAGVSKGTVDRVLHDRGRYSAVTAKKVWAAVEELNYQTDFYASNLSKKRKIKIAILTPYEKQGDSYWRLPLLGARKAVDELSIYNFSMDFYHFDRFNSDDYFYNGKMMIEGDYDGFIIVPEFVEETKKLFKLKKNETPVVFINTDIPEINCLCFLGQNAFRSGLIAARLLFLLNCKVNKKTLIIKSSIENKHLSDRVQGFKNNTDIEPLLAIYSDRESYKNILEKYVLKNEIFDIFVTDASVYYVADFLSEHDIKTKVNLIGCDLTEYNKDRTLKGHIDFILTQRPDEMGYESVYFLYKKLLLNEDVDKTRIMPIDILTRENIEYF